MFISIVAEKKSIATQIKFLLDLRRLHVVFTFFNDRCLILGDKHGGKIINRKEQTNLSKVLSLKMQNTFS